MKIEEVLQQYRIPFRRAGESKHVNAGWIGLECPWCGKGTGNFGLGYNLASGRLSCWKSGVHKLIPTLAALTGLPEREFYKLRNSLQRERAPERVGGVFKPPSGVGPLLPPHERYLRKRFRGHSCEITSLVALWGIGGIGMHSRLPWRVYIPITLNGEVVSYTTRTIGDDVEPRYSSCPDADSGIPIHDLLYGEDLARNTIIIVEGPLDVWTIGPGAVCTCGVGFTKAQILRAVQYPVRVVAFDNDDGGRRRSAKLCDQLEVFPGETLRVFLSGKDAIRSPREEVAELRRRYLEV